MARPTPVLPLVGSISAPPGLSRPSRSAASIRDTATRSLIEPPGFIASILATSCGSSPEARRARRTRGVSPMASMIDSLIPVVVSTSLLTTNPQHTLAGAARSSVERIARAASGEDRDCRDGLVVEVLPHDARRSAPRIDVEDVVRRDNDVDAEVVSGLGQFRVEQLERMDGRHDGRRVVDQSRLDQQPELEVGVAAALADAHARAIDGDRAADDEIDVAEVLDARGRAFGQRLIYRRIARDANERFVPGQTRHGHVQRLAVATGATPHRQLWRVGIGFHDSRRLPLRQLGEALCGGLGPTEVRDPSTSTGKARGALAFERPPDTLADLLLGVHGPAGNAPPD